MTALSLEVPRGASELERRFLEPITRRIFAGVPELDYARDQRARKVPPNISLTEFYFRPGALLGTPIAQQNYISSNYTHAGRDIVARGANALLVMVAERAGQYSLSCNPDLTVDVAQAMRRRGAPSTIAAMVNRNLPFMTGDALVPGDFFDVVLDAPEHEHALFGVPNPPIEPVEHVIGLRASALVKDGCTRSSASLPRDACRPLVAAAACAPAPYAELQRVVDGDAMSVTRRDRRRNSPLGEGLLASSEIVHWGMMVLMRAGVSSAG